METAREHFQPDLERGQIAELTRLLGAIDEFKGHWRKLQEIKAERLERLRQATLIESSGSSTRIEGAQLSDAEVARVLQGLKVDNFRERDEAEVRGYGELLQTIFESWADIPLTENHIRQLHRILLGHVQKDERHRGEYKKFPNDIEATHPDGRKEVVFRTATPFDTPRRMAALVDATNQALEEGRIAPLVIIARFVVEFLAIHPFQDGNGRLSRALTVLLMLRAGYGHVPYASLEHLVEENKGRYYTALRTTQQALERNPHDFGVWLLFFLELVHAHTKALQARLDVEQSIVRLSEIQQKIFAAIEQSDSMTTTALIRLTGKDRRTVQYHLDMLVRRGLIEAHGERKGRYYTRALGGATAGDRAESWNGAVLGAILERGGAVNQEELRDLLAQHGAPTRAAGPLHGRRQAHLRRDPATGKSVLTSRGRELAEQFLFARRLDRTPDIRPERAGAAERPSGSADRAPE